MLKERERKNEKNERKTKILNFGVLPLSLSPLSLLSLSLSLFPSFPSISLTVYRPIAPPPVLYPAMALRKCAPWLFEGRDHIVSQAEAEAVNHLFGSVLPCADAETETELTKKDSNGFLPLHKVAAYAKGRYAIDVFRPMFIAYPLAAKRKTNSGALPLHIVARNMSGAEGVVAMRMLLKAHPGAVQEKNDDGCLPLHFVAKYMGGLEGLQATQLLLAKYPQAAKEKDADDYLPIHLICQNENGATLEMVRVLLVAYPEAITEEDCDGDRPYTSAVCFKHLPLDAIEFLRCAEQGEHPSAVAYPTAAVPATPPLSCLSPLLPLQPLYYRLSSSLMRFQRVSKQLRLVLLYLRQLSR